MGKGAKAPPARDYGKEMTDSLQAQIRLAPELYDAESKYRPLYSALDMQSLDTQLNGQKASVGTRTVSKDGWTNGSGQFVAGERPANTPITELEKSQMGGMRFHEKRKFMNGLIARNSWTAGKGNVTENYDIPASRGLIDVYSNDIAPAYSRMENTARAASVAGDMDVMSRYGQQASDLIRRTSGNEGLLKTLNAQAQSELDAGATLDPSLRREVQQSIRAGQAARGFGMGVNDMAAESYMTAMQAEQLRRARQGFGMQMVGLNQATGGDPFMALLGRQSSLPGAQAFGGNAQATSKGIGNVLFNPESQYSADINNQSYQAQAAASAGNAANKSAMMGAGIGAAGAIGAGLIVF